MMGNLLYLDAPLTGYAYNFLPEGVSAPEAEFTLKNCNPFIDAAQVLRVLLRFLKNHPLIRNNPVILVGESYGGTRTTVMLNMMLFYRNYRPESRGDEYLPGRGFGKRNSGSSGRGIPGNQRAPRSRGSGPSIRGASIMIEPQLTGKYQSELTGIAFEKPGSSNLSYR